MSPLTLFLARTAGLYCVILALAMMANRKATLAAMDDILRSPALTLTIVVFTLMLGLAWVIGHNVWHGGLLPVLVTLFGWATLLKALTMLFLPTHRMRVLYENLNYERHFHLYMGVLLILGLYLTLAGFMA
jgi:hypothetical protein